MKLFVVVHAIGLKMKIVVVLGGVRILTLKSSVMDRVSFLNQNNIKVACGIPSPPTATGYVEGWCEMAVKCLCGEDITDKYAPGGLCSTECNSFRMEVYRMSQGSDKKTVKAIDTLCNTLAYEVFSRSIRNDREVAKCYVRWKKDIPAIGEEARVRNIVNKAIEKLLSNIERSFS